MAVVVNEFEVLPAAPAAPPPKDGERAQEPPRDPPPATVSLALRTLEVQALRSWAH